jgi:hypothetical protein
MKKPTKILLGGALCAALIAAVGALNTARLKNNLRALEAQCERERTELRPKLVCDAGDLSDLVSTGPLVGIQAQIAEAHDDVRNSSAMPGLLAIGILIISAIPWTWYFLLRRIRELREAIVVK